ncbi:DNA-directed RNA polymerases IV and V subunit 2-like protein, partial [Tanacetum coccineum]
MRDGDEDEDEKKDEDQAFGTDALLHINNRSMTAETLGEEYSDITQIEFIENSKVHICWFPDRVLPPTLARRALFIVYQSAAPCIAERVRFNSTLLCCGLHWSNISTGSWSHSYKSCEKTAGVVAFIRRATPLQMVCDMRRTRQQVLYDGKAGDARYP